MALLVFDIEGTSLTDEDISLINHPLVGGLILFSRNYESASQIQELCDDIKFHARRPFLVGVDQEGGRVQRFKGDFTVMPPMLSVSQKIQDPTLQADLTRALGLVMASEIKAAGVDISFAPVLDFDRGYSRVIGDRAFGDSPEQIIRLAESYIDGMHMAHMASVGKHFPGHGYVAEDSHTELPVDNRSYDEIAQSDLSIFARLAHKLDAVMPAHVIYPQVSMQPAGFSGKWLKHILVEQLDFNGVIFSDDLSMKGACESGSVAERFELAQEAGCHYILLCNDREAVIELIDEISNHGVIHGLNRDLQQRVIGPPSEIEFTMLRHFKPYMESLDLLKSNNLIN